MMTATLREPEKSKQGNGLFGRMRQHYRRWLRRILWRCSFVLLASGSILLKYGMIGPVGMRRIWKCADLLEHWAERLGFR
jgi:hypothetical protein